MSLINDMLKDLDQRRAKEQPNKNEVDLNYLAAPVENVFQKYSKKKFVRYGMVALLLILLFVMVWVFIPSKEKTAVKQEVQKVVSKVSIVKKASSSQAPAAITVTPVEQHVLANAAELSSIDMTMTKKQVDIDLKLSDTVHYQIYHNNKQHSVTLILDNVTLSTDFQNNMTPNTIIKSIKVQKFHDDLELVVAMVPETALVNLGYDKNGVLMLHFSHPTINAEAVTEAPADTSQTVVEAVKLTKAERMELVYNNLLKDLPGASHEAVDAIKKYLTKYPDYLPARMKLITLLMAEQQYSSALEAADVGLQLMPDTLDLVILKARVFAMQGHDNRALTLLDSYSPTLESAPDYYALMAGLQQRTGNYQVAIQLYQQLLEYQPTNSVWWMGLGISLEAIGQQNAAMAAYQKALDTGNLSPSLRAYIGSRLQKIGA